MLYRNETVPSLNRRDIYKSNIKRRDEEMILAVVGGGGREHAIIKKLKENKTIEKI